MKSITTLVLIIALGLICTYIGILPINNLVDILTREPPHEQAEQLGYRNITADTYQKLKEESPIVAAELISEEVGSEYFERNFYLYSMIVLNSTDGDWFAQVLYVNNIQVGNHTYLCDASVWFDENGQVIRTEGIPDKANLVPFKVTEDQAIAIAKYCVKPAGYTSVEARISYVGTYDIKPRIDRYAWVVTFRRITGRDLSHGNLSGKIYGTDTYVILDTYMGWVYNVKTVQWIAIS